MDPRSSVTLDAINLKFGTRDYYVVGATQHAKNYNNRPSSPPPLRKGVKYDVQIFIFYFSVISCAALENTFLEVSPRQTTYFGGDWFPRGLNFKIKNFPLLNSQNMNF